MTREDQRLLAIKARLLANPPQDIDLAKHVRELGVEASLETARTCLAIFDGDVSACDYALHHAVHIDASWLPVQFATCASRKFPDLVVAQMHTVRTAQLAEAQAS